MVATAAKDLADNAFVLHVKQSLARFYCWIIPACEICFKVYISFIFIGQ